MSKQHSQSQQNSLPGDPDERSPLLASPKPTANVSVKPVSTPVDAGADDAAFDTASTVSISTSSSQLHDIEGRANSPGAPGLVSKKSDLNLGTVVRAIVVLMIGVFVSNADGSLVLATHPLIASEFNALESSSWLFSSFILAGAATQTMYGKLSDIYGRKSIIITSYILFSVGCAMVGSGTNMGQVILGRAISGGGGAGMQIVSIIISDLLPLRDVATWRAYVNVAATTGRSIGGPLGGWLADAVGWRWSFFGQVPFMVVAAILCAIYLPKNSNEYKGGLKKVRTTEQEITAWGRLKRVDILGSLLLAVALLALLLPMELGGVKVPWSDPILWILFASSIVFFALFIFVEQRATEPVVPLDIFRVRDANLSLIIMTLQSAAQLGLMFSVPLYFTVSAGASNTVAGAHLFPAVAGNAVGGIVSGIYIKVTGRYRNMIRMASVASSFAYTLLLIRWHGHTNWWESLYIAPGGFGSGLAMSAVFVSLQAVVDPAHIAPAISLMYLAGTVAAVLGIACVSLVLQEAMRSSLTERLLELGLDPDVRAEILSKATASIDNVTGFTGSVKEAVVGAYVDGVWWTHTVSLSFSSAAVVASLFMGEKPLNKSPQEHSNNEDEP